jgi:hypothetical protein
MSFEIRVPSSLNRENLKHGLKVSATPITAMGCQ